MRRNTSAGCSSTMAMVETLVGLKFSARLRRERSSSFRFQFAIVAASRFGKSAGRSTGERVSSSMC